MGRYEQPQPMLGAVPEQVNSPEPSAPLLGTPAVLQDVFRVKVLNLGRVAQHLVIRPLEKLLAAIAQLAADGLLHAGILPFALSSRLFGEQLDDAEADDGLWPRIRQ